ncbi:4-diphosphocytidyl-2-C-methyl-D-erythritol kinase, chloroplast precursor [Ectocarpus siliculosus]|uniref:4-(cytidine 5'-diphospho)-2-C-methyl-D-erythritol kinase n=1 Tax=Ectocarpus siliculosus TaxID=2880 RepID=D7G6C7_ECTSI|nr:4-diphosphocytidyl-2-C-methyl-D-erythritol kinase, chloroplast precursor [Ectocarpus siliculosus]|eukprot:CBJ27522.1 4-diphosphocytidyl-2-C-methyl-D-erythritol kinase, chloroplast precursor [Ectocarpus siliculosus]
MPLTMKLEALIFALASVAPVGGFLVGVGFPQQVANGLVTSQRRALDVSDPHKALNPASCCWANTRHRGLCAVSSPDSTTPVGEWDANFFSPAKINLFLRILGKRPDGFHDLASLFQTVGFGDKLFFRKLPESAVADTFNCNMEGVPTDGSNLVLRALDLFRKRTSSQQFYEVYLSKRIPPEAGLGGGSANAATALFAANKLAGHPASLEDLQLWSAELGSDITFFLSTGTCYCTGRGEVLHPQEPLPQTRVWLVKPNKGLSTPVVFRHLDYDQLSRIEPAGLLKQFIEEGLAEADYVNDLELPAFKAMPSLQTMKEELQTLGFEHVLMSGSGSTIFCIGSPTHGSSWTKEFAEKWGAMVVDTHFINRPVEDNAWYAEA